MKHRHRPQARGAAGPGARTWAGRHLGIPKVAQLDERPRGAHEQRVLQLHVPVGHALAGPGHARVSRAPCSRQQGRAAPGMGVGARQATQQESASRVEDGCNLQRRLVPAAHKPGASARRARAAPQASACTAQRRRQAATDAARPRARHFVAVVYRKNKLLEVPPRVLLRQPAALCDQLVQVAPRRILHGDRQVMLRQEHLSGASPSPRVSVTPPQSHAARRRGAVAAAAGKHNSAPPSAAQCAGG
jgi:hypothetical protein